MNTPQKPVTIVTGFLGAGKTTYLNHLLEQKKGTRFAIIENEFGEHGIDSDLVVHPQANIVELNNGCLCCTLNDNLYDILSDLFQRKDDFDEIIIEATGVADPTGLAEPFMVHQLIKEYFPLQGVVCLVDAELIADQLEETEEAKNQVAFSDVLLINKTDLVSYEYVKTLTAQLEAMNPLASIVNGQKNSYPTIELDPNKTPLEQIFKIDARKSTLEENQTLPFQKPHSHHHHQHTDEVVSHTVRFDRPFRHELMEHQLFVYLTLQAQGLYRMKGLVWFEDSNDQHVVQSVGKRFGIEKRNSSQSAEKKESVMVFIGKNLQRKGIEKLLNRCLSKKTNVEI